MHLIEAIVRRPVTVAVGVILVALFGTIALVTMPMQLTPEVQTPMLKIETRWPGASPQEIENQIIQPQEEQLNKGVEGLYKMTSESMDSLGRITLEFDVGTKMSDALQLVDQRLQEVKRYPINSDKPVITTSAADRFIAWFILNVRTPTVEEIEAFEATHPELQTSLAHV